MKKRCLVLTSPFIFKVLHSDLQHIHPYFHPVIVPFFYINFLVITVCQTFLFQTHWFG